LNPTTDSPIHKLPNDLELRQSPLAASGQQTRFTGSLSVTLSDPELRRVIEAWDVLSEPVRKAIIALVATALVD
jgi:hypothetical protein